MNIGGSGGSVGGRPLTNEAVFRIEVSLSSRKSSAIVMRTTARLYTLDQKAQAAPGTKGDAEWKSVAYGAPCIQMTRESTEHNSPFHIKLVIAEVESGISLWETELDHTSKYNAMQNNFHTFSAIGKTFAVQFANNDEAARMLESLKDLMEQKQKAETVSFEKKPAEAIFKKPKSLRRLNKKDISAPCNFKHVSGITLNRTQTCEEELRGTIQRKMRSMSLSNLTRRRVNGDSTDGPTHQQIRDLDVSPSTVRRAEAGGSLRSARSGSLLHKFGSLRLTKKKPYSSIPVKIKGEIPPRPTGGYSNGGGVTQPGFVRDERRQSLPAHVRRQARPPLASDTFITPGGRADRQSPLRSFSTDDLATSPSATNPQKPKAPLERRHTIVLDPTSPRRQAINQQFNYTPYAVNNQPQQNGTRHHSVTGLNHPNAHTQQQYMQQQHYYRNGTTTQQAPLGSNRPYVSDMSLNRNVPVGYSHPPTVVQGHGPGAYATAPRQQRQQRVEMSNGSGVNWAPAAMSSSVGHLHMGGGGGGSVSGAPQSMMPVDHHLPPQPQMHHQQLQHHRAPQVVPAPNGSSLPPSSTVPHSIAMAPAPPVSGGVAPPLQSPTRQQPQQHPHAMSNPVVASSGMTVRSVGGGDQIVSTAARGEDPKPYATVGIGSVSAEPRIASKSGQVGFVLSSVPQGGISAAPHNPVTSTVPVANGTAHTTSPSHRPREVIPTSDGPQHYDVLNPKSARSMPRAVTTAAPAVSHVNAGAPVPPPNLQQNNQPPPPQGPGVSQPLPQHQATGPMQHWSLMKSGSVPPQGTAYPIYTKPPSPRLRQFQRYAKSTSPATQRRAETNVSMSHTRVIPAPMLNGHSYSPKQQQQQPNHPVPVKGPQMPQTHMEQPPHTTKDRQTHFQPHSTQAYDTLPTGPDNKGDDPGSRDLLADTSSVSLTEELAQYTEQMSKALEQFDSLLQPQAKRQIMQTSL